MTWNFLLSLWCAGVLPNCSPVAKERFRFTCLSCRTRRRLIGKFVDPSYWIEYTYKSKFRTVYKNSVISDGVKYVGENGSKIKVEYYTTVRIDPRGKFTAVRCAAIIVLDKIMEKAGLHKPLEEFCEFLANYPV